ncbi:hypothetical protein [Allocoleopsis sp.]|uniref:hypothetical protein n=1 Tax=Allocoleopsis sp. TaxID=3088169 RepID=UPI002FD02BBF
MEKSESLTMTNYRDRWNKEILPRRDELLRRFPDFAPCLSLQQVGNELEYSFYMVPVTKKAVEIKEYLPNFFPVLQQFQPIEMMWRDTGTNEIDLFLEMFPSQALLEKGLEDKKKEFKRRKKVKEARLVLAKIGIITLIVASMNIFGNAAEKSKLPTMCQTDNQPSGIQR